MVNTRRDATELDALRKALEVVERDKAKITEELETDKKKIESLAREQEMLNISLAELKGENAEMQKKLASFQKEKATLRIENEQLKGAVQRFEKEEENLRARISALEQETGMPKEEKPDAEIADLRMNLSSLQLEKITLSIENEQLKYALARLEKEEYDLQNKISSLEREVHRPKLLPEELAVMLKNALMKMEGGLQTSGGRVGYIIGQFDADIKASLSVDEDNNFSMKLPYPGEMVNPESLSTIKLSFSSVPRIDTDLIEVPQCIGMSRETAIGEIQKAGLISDTEERLSPSPAGTVIDQRPEPYTEISSQGTVLLTLSVPQVVVTPKLTGRLKEDALQKIKDNHLIAGEIRQELSAGPPEIVLDQKPAEGTEVEGLSRVDLVVSEEGVTVPSVINQRDKEAIESLYRANLSAGEISHTRSLDLERVVLQQSPSPGDIVKAGSSVALTVAEPVSIKELKSIIRSDEEAQKNKKLFQSTLTAIDRLEIHSPDEIKKLIEVSDEDLKRTLGLQTDEEAKKIRKVIERVFSNLAAHD